LSGISTIVVTPPAAAARVAVANPSHAVRPGSFTCTWVSTTPGITTSSPTSTTGTLPGADGVAPGATPTILPARIAISAGPTVPPLTTRRLRSTHSSTIGRSYNAAA
jgi:hypothetical protein